jgi:hypothetical protein
MPVHLQFSGLGEFNSSGISVTVFGSNEQLKVAGLVLNPG